MKCDHIDYCGRCYERVEVLERWYKESVADLTEARERIEVLERDAFGASLKEEK